MKQASRQASNKTKDNNTKNCLEKWGKSITLYSKTINKHAVTRYNLSELRKFTLRALHSVVMMISIPIEGNIFLFFKDFKSMCDDQAIIKRRKFHDNASDDQPLSPLRTFFFINKVFESSLLSLALTGTFFFHSLKFSKE